MKKGPAIILALVTALALLCTVAFLLHRNESSGSLQIRSAEPSRPTVGAVRDEADPDPGPVDINTADLAALMTLPGVGQTLAARIIDYRNTHGPFHSVAELLKVEGIGPGKLESILDLITTGGTT